MEGNLGEVITSTSTPSIDGIDKNFGKDEKREINEEL